jgi:hypothetical protein
MNHECVSGMETTKPALPLTACSIPKSYHCHGRKSMTAGSMARFDPPEEKAMMAGPFF